jgi:hypothetical protein
MRYLSSILSAAALAALLAGCGGSGGGGGGTPGPSGNDFAAFVKAQIDATENTTDPVDVNAVPFVNVLSDDETLFDDVLMRYSDRRRKPDAP